jgi:hypothetical protein
MKRQLYPANWKQRVQEADVRAGGRCEGCGAVLGTLRVSRKGNLYFLQLHTSHVNHDPENPQAELRKLCPSCHWHTHSWLHGTRDHTNRRGYQPITQERVLRAARSGGLSITRDATGTRYTWEIDGLTGLAPDMLDAIASALHCLHMERLAWVQQEEEHRHG